MARSFALWVVLAVTAAARRPPALGSEKPGGERCSVRYRLPTSMQVKRFDPCAPVIARLRSMCILVSHGCPREPTPGVSTGPGYRGDLSEHRHWELLQVVPLHLRGGEGANVAEAPQWLKDLECELRKELDAQGNPLSKNELKRRLKTAQKERERQSKAALESKGEHKFAEDDLEPNQYFEHRCAALQAFKDAGETLPYRYDTTTSIPAFRAAHDGRLAPGEQDKEKVERLAGRILQKRVQGKLAFYQLSGGGGKVQIMAGEGLFSSAEEYKKVGSILRRGDVVGVEGYVGVSQKGELSLFATSMTLLAPCLRMLPKISLNDPETRFRQRYLDLIINPQVPLCVRAQIDSNGSVWLERGGAMRRWVGGRIATGGQE